MRGANNESRPRFKSPSPDRFAKSEAVDLSPQSGER